ncbi:hypothetical protein ABZP36_028059 [Zizania latifolia]
MATSPLLLLLLLLGMSVSLQGSEGAWCVCRPDVAEAALQKALDYACGHGADCAPVTPSGPCYSPNSVAAHCSYAANSYFQRNGQAKGATCDFGGAATLSSTDPSTLRNLQIPCNRKRCGDKHWNRHADYKHRRQHNHDHDDHGHFFPRLCNHHRSYAHHGRELHDANRRVWPDD